MLLKDEEIKKYYTHIQSLKSTMSDLEDGIQVYQAMAEEKEKETEEEKEKNTLLHQEILELKHEQERI